MVNIPFNAEFATKYLSASALTYALWDHIITFDDEVKYMWSKKFNYNSFFFAANRYGVETGLLYSCYVISGLHGKLDDSKCRQWFGTSTAVVTVLSVSSNIYTIIHHYTLWERRKWAMYILIIGMAIAYVPGTVFAILFLVHDIKFSVFEEEINSCLLLKFPDEGKGFYACIIAFDVFAFFVIVVNALHRPYKRSSDVINGLRRDGAISFIALMLLRVALLATVCILPSTEFFLIALNIWALLSIIYARLMLKVEEARIVERGVQIWVPSAQAFELMTRSTSL